MKIRHIVGSFLQLVGGGCCAFSLIIFLYNLGITIFSVQDTRASHSPYANIGGVVFVIIWPLGFTGIFWGIWRTGKFLSGATKSKAYNQLVAEYDKLLYKLWKNKQDQNLPDK